MKSYGNIERIRLSLNKISKTFDEYFIFVATRTNLIPSVWKINDSIHGERNKTNEAT